MMLQKRLFYLSENRLSAWQWRGGRLSLAESFDADAGGLANFSDYLAKAPDPGTPIYMLLDVIEEDFRNETIPHILGKDRHTLIARKLGQLLRTSSYRHASPQGREAGGRRDDRLLLTGLTNEALIEPWVERILKLKQPLAGIWSLPLLSQILANKLGLAAPHQLLITRQASTGLRQSYFQHGQLKFSRLTMLSEESMAAMQETISREASRTQQYLNSLRLLPRDAVLEIAVCGASHLFLLQPEAMDTPLLRYQLFSLKDIIGDFGFKAPAVELTSEILYLHLLGRYAPPQHYASPGQLWYRRLRLARAAILGATVMVLAAASYVTAKNLDQALADHRQSEKITRETQGYFAQYQAIKNTFPPTPATPENMESAVELMRAVHAQDVMPHPLMALVSRALEKSATIRLNRIKWQAGEEKDEGGRIASKDEGGRMKDEVTSGDVTSVRAPAGTSDSSFILHPSSFALSQTAVLEGEIIPFSNFRNALEDVKRFIATLNQNPSLRASALTMPLDVASSASLQGSVGERTQEKAFFSIKLVFAPAMVLKDEGGRMKDEMRKGGK